MGVLELVIVIVMKERASLSCVLYQSITLDNLTNADFKSIE